MFTTLKRFWPPLVLAAGLALMAGGFIYDVLFAGIPYQDPTPQMSANYARHAYIASAIRWCGCGLFLLAAFIGCGRWAVQRQKTQNEKPIN